MISCYHLNIPHPRRDGALLDDVSFELEQGSWADITGESGCGKSVLFELLSLRLLTREGTLIVGGRNLDRLPRRKLESLPLTRDDDIAVITITPCPAGWPNA